MTPTERLLTILRHVKEADESGAVGAGTSAEILDAMASVYAGQSGQRKWRRDIRTLRDRGLIETDRPPNRTGIRLSGPRKPSRLHLTGQEHEAINRARVMLRVGVSPASPLRGQIGGEHAEVDDVARIVRFLEENDDEVSLAQLAHWLEVSEQRVMELVEVLVADGIFGDGLVASVEFGYDGDDDEDDGAGPQQPLPATVWILRGRNRHNPTRGRGMDELGFFPYSLAEVKDRLDLIDRALAIAAPIPDDMRAALRSAAGKLSEWRVELER